jgi:uncharacterized membrane protein YhfC
MKVYILLTVLAMTALAVVPAILWKHKTKASWKSYFIGFVIFMLFARILEPLLHMVCLIIDSPVSRLINHSAILYGLYGGLAAGLFEETGRYTAFRWILKNQKRPADAVMYGWGHGGIEILTIIVPVLILALLPNPDPAVQAALPDMTIAYLASALFERILAVSIHVCLSVWVWKAVHKKKDNLVCSSDPDARIDRFSGRIVSKRTSTTGEYDDLAGYNHFGFGYLYYTTL